jgi:hypothetical protein
VRDTSPGQVITSNHGQSEEQVSVLAQQNAAQTAYSCQFTAMAANAEAQVGQRPVPDEPMYAALSPLVVLQLLTRFPQVSDYEPWYFGELWCN